MVDLLENYANLDIVRARDPNDCILKVDMDSDFNRGFKFTVNDEDITRIMLKTRV